MDLPELVTEKILKYISYLNKYVIYFSHDYRGSVYQLYVEPLRDVLCQDYSFDEVEESEAKEVRENHDRIFAKCDMICLIDVAEKPRDKEYLVVFDPDIEVEKQYIWCNDPLKTIREYYVGVGDDYSEEDPELTLDDFELRYQGFDFSSGGMKNGTRIINANKPYPEYYSKFKTIDYKEDYCNLIYVYKLD